MATRDFKIRTGLVVTGNTEIQGSLTVGGNTITKILDSDEVSSIISSSVTGLADSDLKAIADLRNDVDSDSIAIQAIQTDLETAESNITTIQSDISTINAKLDSDSIRIQTLQGEVDALTAGTYNDAPLVARLDSDSIAIQSLGTTLNTLDTKVNSIEAALDSETARIQLLLLATDSDSLSIAGLKTEADSDANAIAELLRQADSDATAIQALRTELTSDIDTINVRLDSDEIAIQAVRNDMDISFNVANNGASAYTFTGDGFPSGVDNPTLYLERGHTYNFRVNASGHPFEIRQASGGAAYSSGVTNNAAQVGLVRFVVPMDAPDTLAYQCTVHSGMVGVIKIGKAGFDSDQIVGIINANVVTDPTINTRLDSDEIKIQALGTSIESLNTTLSGLSGSAAIQTTVYTYTATQGQTTFSGVDSNGLTLDYAPGYIYVFVNGVLVLDGTDYTATTGTSIVLTEAADSDNTIQIIKHVGTVQTGFDSDQVVAIINENTSPDIVARLDSDEIKIQDLQTQISNVTSFDSDQIVSIVGENTVVGLDSETTLNFLDRAFTTPHTVDSESPNQICDSWSKTKYMAVEYLVTVRHLLVDKYQVSKVIVLHDNTVGAIVSEYAVLTTDSDLCTFDAQLQGNTVSLLAAPTMPNLQIVAKRQGVRNISNLPSVNALIVGGGGGGSWHNNYQYGGSGGGGGVQVIEGFTALTGSTYSITVGSGGTGATGNNGDQSAYGIAGGTSTAFGYSATGGARGDAWGLGGASGAPQSNGATGKASGGAGGPGSGDTPGPGIFKTWQNTGSDVEYGAGKEKYSTGVQYAPASTGYGEGGGGVATGQNWGTAGTGGPGVVVISSDKVAAATTGTVTSSQDSENRYVYVFTSNGSIEF